MEKSGHASQLIPSAIDLSLPMNDVAFSEFLSDARNECFVLPARRFRRSPVRLSRRWSERQLLRNLQAIITRLSEQTPIGEADYFGSQAADAAAVISPGIHGAFAVSLMQVGIIGTVVNLMTFVGPLESASRLSGSMAIGE